MKKLFFAAFALLAICSCSNEDPIPVPDYVVANFEGSQWDALIDNPQYGGALLYSRDEYKWTDGTTALTSECTKADWGMDWGWGWNNGIAISNYIDSDLSHGDYLHQLSVPVSNGSKNFAVVWDNDSKLTFADGKARVIRAMEVCLTTYSLADIIMKKKNHGEDYKFFVTATGTLADGSTKTKEIVLAEGKEKVMDKWTVVSLAELGAVKEVSFAFDGTDKSDYGVKTPKYFAFDNVIIEK